MWQNGWLELSLSVALFFLEAVYVGLSYVNITRKEHFFSVDLNDPRRFALLPSSGIERVWSRLRVCGTRSNLFTCLKSRLSRRREDSVHRRFMWSVRCRDTEILETWQRPKRYKSVHSHYRPFNTSICTRTRMFVVEEPRDHRRRYTIPTLCSVTCLMRTTRLSGRWRLKESKDCTRNTLTDDVNWRSSIILCS